MTVTPDMVPQDGAVLRERTFWRRLGSIEHEQLEFKRSAHHVGEAITAMAMTHGGVIVLGVTDGRAFVGCALDQDTLD